MSTNEEPAKTAEDYGLDFGTYTQLRAAFQMFDVSGDGSLELEELCLIFDRLDPEHRPTRAEVKEMMDEIDVDGNGELDCDEFLQMVSKQIHMSDYGDDDILSTTVVSTKSNTKRKEKKKKEKSNPSSPAVSSPGNIASSDAFKKVQEKKKQVEFAFRLWDTNASGFLSINEIQHVLADQCGVQVCRRDIREMIALVDTNLDGKLSIEEFTDYILKRY